MSSFARPIFSLVVFAPLFWSVAASADDTAKASSSEPPPKAKTGEAKTTNAVFPTENQDKVDTTADEKHLKGLELVLRPSFGGAPAGSPIQYQPKPNAGIKDFDPGPLVGGTQSPYGAGFIGQAMIGYRFHPIISGGLRGGMRNQSGSLSDGSTDLTRSSWDAGFYVRAYPLALSPAIRKHIDPWVGVGAEYMRDTQTFNKTVQGLAAEWKLDHHAVAVPLGIGVDYRVLPMLSVGPSFEYTLANTVNGCLGVTPKASGFISQNFCANDAPGKDFIKADSYGVWSAGLDIRATL